MPIETILIFLAIGSMSGAFGGLLGIGGSAIFIPAATLCIGPDQQIYQAAAMIMNVVVSGTATLKHHRKKAISWPLVMRMTPFAICFAIIGVFFSNLVNGQRLMQIFGVLLWIIAATEIINLIVGKKKNQEAQPHKSPRESLPVLGSIGGMMGISGGFLGIGGGVIALPLLNRLARIPLRKAIAVTACVTLPMSLIGAIVKNMTLHNISQDGIPLSMWNSLAIAAAVVPTAVIGSWIGASLVHILPVTYIRGVFACLLIFAGLKMTGTL